MLGTRGKTGAPHARNDLHRVQRRGRMLRPKKKKKKQTGGKSAGQNRIKGAHDAVEGERRLGGVKGGEKTEEREKRTGFP